MLACHYGIVLLDGFDHTTLHFPLSGADDEPQQHRQFFGLKFFLAMLGIKPRAAGSGSQYANHCAMLPPPFISFLNIYVSSFYSDFLLVRAAANKMAPKFEFVSRPSSLQLQDIKNARLAWRLKLALRLSSGERRCQSECEMSES